MVWQSGAGKDWARLGKANTLWGLSPRRSLLGTVKPGLVRHIGVGPGEVMPGMVWLGKIHGG